jgi:hypothetical protein
MLPSESNFGNLGIDLNLDSELFCESSLESFSSFVLSSFLLFSEFFSPFFLSILPSESNLGNLGLDLNLASELFYASVF